MIIKKLINKCYNKSRIYSSKIFAKHSKKMISDSALISFSFDDFPKNALYSGGKILKEHGFVGTYYLSYGLLGKDTSCGKIIELNDLDNLIIDGHELGCHTYDHLDAWFTPPEIFEKSIIKSKAAINDIFPDVKLSSFAYPIGHCSPKIKKIIQKHFLCARGGSHRINNNIVDLNFLNSFFLDKRLNLTFNHVKQIIDENLKHNGWLIFATHDISDNPSPYGCETNLFKKIVDYVSSAKIKVFTITDAVKYLKF